MGIHIGHSASFQWEKTVIPPDIDPNNVPKNLNLAAMGEMQVTCQYDPGALNAVILPNGITYEGESIDKETGEVVMNLSINPDMIEVTVNGIPLADLEKTLQDEEDRSKGEKV